MARGPGSEGLADLPSETTSAAGSYIEIFPQKMCQLANNTGFVLSLIVVLKGESPHNKYSIIGRSQRGV